MSEETNSEAERGPFDLTGRVAVVTGGNGGIGFAIARGLARAGAKLVVVGRNPDKSAKALEALHGEGVEVTSILADVTDETDCRRIVERTIEAFGRLDILVNNVGTNDRRQPHDYSMADWHHLVDTNLTSVFAMSIAALEPLKVRGGKVINIGSMTSVLGASFAAPYGAAKGGVMQLTKSLASAWAGHDIQVNVILPGWIETELTIRGRAATPDLQDKVIARTPAGRWGLPDDLAGAAVFLASPASDFVTGVVLPVDGGYSAQA
ncbi:MAG: glucose 1-dehydrogenase [Hyphomicrobiales bacterium]|nr:glucose 1-dehydrogenase [Hyphomicrobiales bacterium]